MDIDLAKTFLAVAESGSFVSAAERLQITQTAVSARVRTLEEQLGRRLFVRNKAGARVTAAGQRFARHATTLVQVWERACQQVSLPAGREDGITIGAELSLWHPLLADWMVWMHQHCPQVALRAEVDNPARLLQGVQDGSLDLAVLYNPPERPGLVAELLGEEKLVLVTSDPGGELLSDQYIHVDWGPAFAASHQAAYPELSSPPVSISLGPLALGYLLSVGGSGYFRVGAAGPLLDSGRLHRVAGAPEFSYSAYVLYATQQRGDVMDRVRDGLRAVAAGIKSPEVPAHKTVVGR